MQFSVIALTLLAAGAQATVTSSVTETVSSIYTATVTSCGSEVSDCPATSAAAPSSTLDAYGSSVYPSSTLDAYGSTLLNSTNTTASIGNFTGGASSVSFGSFALGAAALFGAAAVIGL